ncbi:MAG: transglycosylase domain-containing protein [Gemmatimonadaceae bacterium]|nr:transglycosylase domain-containing protein [Gloeobacterales cyanobacterium ES-bin-141]
MRARTVVLTLILLLVVGIGGAVGTWVWLTRDLPSVETLAERIRLPRGQELAYFEQFPLSLRQAVVASEDRRFYEHSGIDPWGILRAMVRNSQERELVEGGSTITQQLARNLFLDQQKTPERKLKEIVLAWRLEGRYTKNDILTSYLNRVYLGSGAYGVVTASKRYFNKPVEELSVGESALLAGIIPAPSVYNPRANPKLSRERRNTVLQAMVEAEYLTQVQADRLVQMPLNLSVNQIARP